MASFLWIRDDWLHLNQNVNVPLSFQVGCDYWKVTRDGNEELQFPLGSFDQL
jgi:hypothetical protein